MNLILTYRVFLRQVRSVESIFSDLMAELNVLDVPVRWSDPVYIQVPYSPQFEGAGHETYHRVSRDGRDFFVLQEREVTIPLTFVDDAEPIIFGVGSKAVAARIEHSWFLDREPL